MPESTAINAVSYTTPRDTIHGAEFDIAYFCTRAERKNPDQQHSYSEQLIRSSWEIAETVRLWQFNGSLSILA
jgi:hypothetical protein